MIVSYLIQEFCLKNTQMFSKLYLVVKAEFLEVVVVLHTQEASITNICCHFVL